MHKLLNNKGVFTLKLDSFISDEGLVNRVSLSGVKKSGEADSIEFEYVFINNSSLTKPKVLDGFVCAVIFYLMEHAYKLEVAGPLSQEFVRNMRIFGEAWKCWFPDLYAPVELEASSYISIKKSLIINLKSIFSYSPKKALLTFSGGVDACFSLMRHARTRGTLNSNERYGVDRCVMVQGFDIQFRNDTAFYELNKRVKPILREFGVDCLMLKRILGKRCRKIGSIVMEHK